MALTQVEEVKLIFLLTQRQICLETETVLHVENLLVLSAQLHPFGLYIFAMYYINSYGNCLPNKNGISTTVNGCSRCFILAVRTHYTFCKKQHDSILITAQCFPPAKKNKCDICEFASTASLEDQQRK